MCCSGSGYATSPWYGIITHRTAKDPRFMRLPCSHKGTYADDCIVARVMAVRASMRKE